MGMDIYLMKPAIVPTHIWEGFEGGKDVRYLSMEMRALFKKFIYVKHKTHTLESMAHHCRVSVPEFIKLIDSQEHGKRSTDYPYLEKFEYIHSEEIGYMDGNAVKSQYHEILGSRTLYCYDTIKYLSYNMFCDLYDIQKSEWLSRFNSFIMSVFKEGETFIEFK